ncbi:unnamed protein product [marine sediment metagenome]|uniref:Uncharacterized protein n=1 Tax=marine sediment metagenome TaxID=412755 RepID=X1A796_9ZZZZ
MSIKEYSKIVIMTDEGKLLIIQPKSWTFATKMEEKELLDLIFKDKYITTTAIIPRMFSTSKLEE